MLRVEVGGSVCSLQLEEYPSEAALLRTARDKIATKWDIRYEKDGTMSGSNENDHVTEGFQGDVHAPPSLVMTSYFGRATIFYR